MLHGAGRLSYRSTMRHIVRLFLLCFVSVGLSACGMIGGLFPSKAPAAAAVAEPVNPLASLGGGVSAASLDTTTEAEKAAALTAPAAASERALGTVTVALGSPTEQGFWIKTNLVSVPAKGRVETGSGASVAVDLIPFDGAALLSFAAFRALNLPLTELPDVAVYAD